MTTDNKGRNRANGATPKATDHGDNSNATAQKIGKSPYGPDFVQISTDEAMQRMCDGLPGVIITRFQHDDWCKTLKTGRGDDCCCNPDESFWLLSEKIGGAA